MGRDQTKSKEVAAMAFSSAFRKKTEEASSLAVASDSTGYKGLYGGLDKRGIQDKKRLKPKDNPLDHMGSTELAANLFHATQTEDKLRREQTKGKNRANDLHFEVGKRVPPDHSRARGHDA